MQSQPRSSLDPSIALAHEIRQPLTIILLQAEAAIGSLQRQNPDLDEAEQGMRRVIEESRRAGDLLKGIRSLLREDPTAFAALDVNRVVQAMLDRLSKTLSDQEIAVRTDLNEVPPVEGNRLQIEQLLVNLIANGAEAMASVQDRERRLTIATRITGGGNVRISVEDTGSGISPKNLQRIFDPFFTTKEEGMGIGLSLCRSIAISHGGRLWARRRRPYGSSINFEFPCLRSPS